MSGEVGAPVVLPNGNTANDGANAVQMPSVPAGTQRRRPSEFIHQRTRGELANSSQARQAQRPEAPQQQPTARDRLGQLSDHLEARQRGEQPTQQPTNDPTNPEEHSQQQPESPETQSEPPAQEPTSLSDVEALERYRDWEKSDLLPDEFGEKMRAVKVRGRERYISVDEAFQGYMRGTDYHERGAELRQREERAQAQDNLYREHFAAIKDPSQFEEIYERNGYGDVLDQVAELRQQKRREHRQLVHAAGYSAALRAGFSHEQIAQGMADTHRDVAEAMRRTHERLIADRKMAIDNRRLNEERSVFQQQQRQQQQQQETGKWYNMYTNQLNQLRPSAFKAYGFADTEQNRAILTRHLHATVQMEPLGDDGFTRDRVFRAAKAMAEELELQAEREGRTYMSPAEQRAHAQAAQRAQALGSVRTGTGGGKPLVPPAGTQRKSAGDFERARRAGTLGRS